MAAAVAFWGAAFGQHRMAAGGAWANAVLANEPPLIFQDHWGAPPPPVPPLKWPLITKRDGADQNGGKHAGQSAVRPTLPGTEKLATGDFLGPRYQIGR